MQKVFFTAVTAAVLSLPVQAQQTLDPLVVTATRSPQPIVATPASLQVVGRDQIERSGAQTLPELLNNLGGIQVYDLYGGGSASVVNMRGFGGSAGAANALVLVDGRRLNVTDLAGPNLEALPLANIERIEILQGSAGALYGDQAVGGVINIITRAPKTNSVELGTAVGSDNTRLLRANAAARLDNGLALRVDGRRETTDGFRENGGKSLGAAHMRADYAYDGGSIMAEYERSEVRRELPGGLSVAELAADRKQASTSFPNDASETNGDIARVALHQRLSGGWNLDVDVTERSEATRSMLWGSQVDQDRRHQSLYPRLVGTLPFRGDAALVTLGADADDVDYDIESAYGATTAKQEVRAMYGQVILPLAPRWSTTLGGRRAWLATDIDDTGAFPGGTTLKSSVNATELGLAFQVNDTTRLFARRDSNFRFPLVDEQTYTSPDVTGLKTQTGISWEAGAQWRRAALHAKALVYRLDLENEIIFDAAATGPWGPGTGANVNLPATRRAGFILEAGAPMTKTVQVAVNYTYTDPTITAGPYEGNTIPFVPRSAARVSADWRMATAWNLYGEILYTAARRIDSDFANTSDWLPKTTLSNLALRWSEGDWSATARINNLTDVVYNSYAATNGYSESYYPAAGRTWLLDLGYRF